MTAPATQVLPATPENIARAAQVLLAGGLVAFPTETVYGLGALALDPTAAQRIYQAKGRPSNNPLIVHVADPSAVAQLATSWPPLAADLAARFWPGPLTLVLPKRPEVPNTVTAGGPTVAIRVPNHPVALALLRAVGQPLAAPSANASNAISPTRAAHVLRTLQGRVDLILDGGDCQGGLESTVVAIATDSSGREFAKILRPGLITSDQLQAAIGNQLKDPSPATPQSGTGLRPVGDSLADPSTPASEPSRSHPITISPQSGAGLRPVQGAAASASPAIGTSTLSSPGQLARHYAPRIPATLSSTNGHAEAAHHSANGRQVGYLGFDDAPPPPAAAKSILLPRAPEPYAARLYDALHQLDDDPTLDQIIIAAIPAAPAWEAIRDRLHRATTPAPDPSAPH